MATTKKTYSKTTTKNATAKKAPAKKDSAKKTPEKKDVVKKTVVKKSATKKVLAKKAVTKTVAKKTTKKVLAKPPAKKTPVPAAPSSPARKLALTIADIALDKKALNVEVIDLYGRVDYADYVVVMSGRSDRQVTSLAKTIAEEAEKKTGSKCLGIEGISGGTWVLMDFSDVIVHVFHSDVRGYYDLETLWMDGDRITA